jgi:hypothetical protein
VLFLSLSIQLRIIKMFYEVSPCDLWSKLVFSTYRLLTVMFYWRLFLIHSNRFEISVFRLPIVNDSEYYISFRGVTFPRRWQRGRRKKNVFLFFTNCTRGTSIYILYITSIRSIIRNVFASQSLNTDNRASTRLASYYQ